MGQSTVVTPMGLGTWGLLLALLGPGYPVRSLDGVRFAESIRTEAITRVATSTHRRLIARDASYRFTLAGDTLVVSADSLLLTELADGSSRSLDTDGFVGGRYHLGLDSVGGATLFARPFVPDDISEVSDVGTAMDDFFPPLPPTLTVGAEAHDSSGHVWHRLADSSGTQRFRWSSERNERGDRDVGGGTMADVTEQTRESSTMTWSATRGPLAWNRRITSDMTTRLRGQTIMATVTQRIAVRRGR